MLSAQNGAVQVEVGFLFYKNIVAIFGERWYNNIGKVFYNIMGVFKMAYSSERKQALVG